ncbi:MAG TPA: glycosyltransferase, partial [Acholeplasma sp.]|nr:glycosyltransferase [Acholeplasma sp.]
MVIVFVIDNYLHQSNGTTITTRRFVEQLRMRGHEVRILSVGQGEEGYYSLKERYIPIVTDVAKHQDVIFSKPDKKVIMEAFKGADVVHFVTPWKTSLVARSIAQKLNIPQTASFHIQPENITYGAGLNNVPFLNSFIYRRFRKFYGKIPFVHAPSNFIASELRNHNYPNTIKVISNGVDDAFFKGEVIEPQGKFHIISTGRY